MEIRVFFQKVRQAEASIQDPFVLITSEETGDGGIPGTVTEVARLLAARLIVEGKARLSTEAEAERYRTEMEERRVEAEQRASVNNMKFTVLPEHELRMLRPAPRGKNQG